jgi:hypothetical protein
VRSLKNGQDQTNYALAEKELYQGKSQSLKYLWKKRIPSNALTFILGSQNPTKGYKKI